MSKKHESGDSDELQALFDSIVGAAAQSSEPETESGDSDELQALFDTVAEQFQASAEADSDASDPGEAAEPPLTPEQRDELYRRIGKVARQLHEALKELGCESVVAEAAQAVPDAKERLRYIAQKTEEAAVKVLNAAEIASPLQKELESKAQALRARWDQLFANQLSPQEFKALAKETHAFLALTEENAHLTAEQLMNIVMAQDFQDLTGQVIKKVIEIVGRIETELLQILIEAMPEELRQKKHQSEGDAALMNGPAVQKGEGVLSSQEEVDDLLSSLGF
ncbi:protein phosphatase CheZ [Hydrogenophilus thermoluteolus]|jgi:chemotaxis protein CheZ|uniref:protein phosphatase CheZ n=1 Tax=Hydrogenophilus thermoluteolus TaxID=297 RepID=UPI000EE0BBB0|nr:protein phosphatase CheZ [Hydrogenophilus thermoluteolus]HCO77048.1 protein phosphatase CheZ [Rhodocyclaceae bacterium]MBW7657046.1 protein phosphatase CheZ [Hydrogenophilus thermoluteolus]GLW61397.1 protein phosphatase CheZ [Hydrogenophilus thermoluteolus]HNQ49357.1 protein phosphatase CheZ [Hydrogenophilus thermoluteolus]HNU19425.1 protein phosphatase CheZ [Hydrogenophilus thermoluteolus]